jgi:hypothetical protein
MDYLTLSSRTPLTHILLLTSATGSPATAQSVADKRKLQQEETERELHQEEHQHVLGVVPYFNTVYSTSALPLNASEHSATLVVGGPTLNRYALCGRLCWQCVDHLSGACVVQFLPGLVFNSVRIALQPVDMPL